VGDRGDRKKGGGSSWRKGKDHKKVGETAESRRHGSCRGIGNRSAKERNTALEKKTGIWENLKLKDQGGLVKHDIRGIKRGKRNSQHHIGLEKGQKMARGKGGGGGGYTGGARARRSVVFKKGGGGGQAWIKVTRRDTENKVRGRGGAGGPARVKKGKRGAD